MDSRDGMKCACADSSCDMKVSMVQLSSPSNFYVVCLTIRERLVTEEAAMGLGLGLTLWHSLHSNYKGKEME